MTARTSKLAGLVACSLGWCGIEPGAAQTVGPTTESGVVLDPITVEGQAGAPSSAIGTTPPPFAGGQVGRGGRVGLLGDRDLFDTPFSTQSFTEELARNQQAQSPADLLRLDPAASVFYSPSQRGNIAGTIFTLRGFEVNSSQATFNGLPGLMSRSENVLAFERVEVIRGPSALLSGQVGGVGGTVNFVPKRAGDRPLTRLTGLYEADGNLGAAADVGRRFGRDGAFGVRLNGGYRDGEIGVEGSDREAQLAALALDYRGERARVAVDLSYDREINTYDNPVSFLPGFAIPDPPDAGKIYSQRWSESDQEAIRAVLATELDLAENWTFGLAGGTTHRDWFYVYPNLNILQEDGTSAEPGSYFRSVSDTYSTEASLRGAIATGPLDHAPVATATYVRTVDGFRSFDLPVIDNDIFDPDYVPRPSLRSIGNVPDRNHQETLTFALADAVSILDGRASLIAGVRHTRIKTRDYDDDAEKTGGYRDAELTPGVGLLVKPLANLSLYGNYIEALEPGGTAPLDADNAGEGLAPFRSKQYEVGAKYDFGSFGATLALFQLERPSAFLDPETNLFSQDGEQRNRGLELTVFGEPVAGVRLLGGYSFIDAELTDTADGADDGNTAPGVPEHRFSALAEWDLPVLPELTLTGAAFRTSKAYLTQDNQQDVPGFTTFDLGARYRVDVAGKPVTLRFAVENVTDNDHWVAATFGGAAALGGSRRFLFSTSFEF